MHRKRVISLFTTATLVGVSFWLALTGSGCAPADYGRPDCNVILISIDTLRSDHLGCYGYQRDTSPVIDRFSGDAITFLSTFAQAPSTTMSHASIFTSLLPSHHGAFYSCRTPIPDHQVTMAEMLQQDGYHTASINDGGQIAARFGFDQGFDNYTSIKHGAPGHSNFIHTARRAIDWLRNRDDDRFFLFLHTYHTHHPYTPPKRFVETMDEGYRGKLPDKISLELLRQVKRGDRQLTRSDKQHIVTLYDAEIRQMDVGFGLIVDELKKLGLYDDMVLILTSDHGEEFGEHGVMGWHSHTLYDELLSVPLIIKLPGNDFAGTRVTTPVRSIDILPTLLDCLDIPPLAVFEGRSLMDLARGRRESPRPVVARQDHRNPTPVILRSGRWKYYHRPGAHKPRILFDLQQDPGETRNAGVEHPEVIDELEQQLADILARRPTVTTGEEVRLPGELEDQLRALGYAE